MESNKISRYFEKPNPNCSPKKPFYLPDDMVPEILKRLPVLMKFRYVSNSWHSLISSKEFIKSHLEISTNNTSLTHHSIILAGFPDSDLRDFPLQSLLHEPSSTPPRLYYPLLIDPNHPIHIVGSCNGLVCIINRVFLLWNPATRERYVLPSALENNSDIWKITNYGFGYDESNDDYKVLAVLKLVYRSDPIVKIYSLKTNLWTRVERFISGELIDIWGKFVNGKLHWAINDYYNLHKIVSFDLTNEVLGVVESNNVGEAFSLFCPSLGSTGGCLCLQLDNLKGHADFWVLKEYGVKESWSKVLVINGVGDPRSLTYYKVSLMCMLQGGYVVYQDGWSFYVFDSKSGLVRSHLITDFSQLVESRVYVKSLVSPFPYGGSDKWI